MLVSQYLDFASKSEVKPLSISDIGEDSPNAVQEDNRKTLISYLNLANIEVHKKFALIQKEFLLEDVEHNKLFDLPIDFLYATNAAYPEGANIPMNNDKVAMSDGEDVYVSVLFPEPFKALVKGNDPNSRTIISLTYVASPPEVSLMNEFLDISNVFTEAILYYIAYKAYGSMQGDIQATNNTYYLRFLDSCKNIKFDGLVTVDNLDSNERLNERGFV